eukprot:TRINITY_DN23629_c0_g2_i1.p1 TRINITY_DN23629_c0_g2~~TRINITY_DN23629_c0_g2_i1.p1  ORF type:complete len:365 (+),score=41.44 TRINITY_DN23629_c0_g2_i1:31-1125(+)
MALSDELPRVAFLRSDRCATSWMSGETMSKSQRRRRRIRQNAVRTSMLATNSFKSLLPCLEVPSSLSDVERFEAKIDSLIFHVQSLEQALTQCQLNASNYLFSGDSWSDQVHHAHFCADEDAWEPLDENGVRVPSGNEVSPVPHFSCSAEGVNTISKDTFLRLRPRYEASAVKSDMRSLPPEHWCRVGELFSGREADRAPEIAELNEAEAVMILKDFTLMIDDTLNQYGVDVSERTTVFRRQVEEAYMVSASDEWSNAGYGTFESIASVLRNIAEVVAEWVMEQHGLSLTCDIDVPAWLRVHREQRRAVSSLCCEPHDVKTDAEQLRGHVAVENARVPRRKALEATPSWTGLAVRKADSGAESH